MPHGRPYLPDCGRAACQHNIYKRIIITQNSHWSQTTPSARWMAIRWTEEWGRQCTLNHFQKEKMSRRFISPHSHLNSLAWTDIAGSPSPSSEWLRAPGSAKLALTLLHYGSRSGYDWRHFLLTCLCGYNRHIVPIGGLPVERLGERHGAIVWVYFESFSDTAVSLNWISEKEEWIGQAFSKRVAVFPCIQKEERYYRPSVN